MLVGKILHSPYPHARIKRIDTSRAERLEGVVAVVVGKDAPNPYGILPVGHDEHALALDKVRYVGDNVACVVAISEAIAEKALELIDVDYEVLPAYFDPEESMKAHDGSHPRQQARTISKRTITTSSAIPIEALRTPITWPRPDSSRMKSRTRLWSRTPRWRRLKLIRTLASPDA